MPLLAALLALVASARAGVPEDLASASDGTLPMAVRQAAYGRIIAGGNVEALVTEAQDGRNPDARRWVAVRALGPMPAKAARDALVKLVDARDAYTRIAALGALAERNDRSDSGRVAGRLRDKALLVRFAAADALGRIKDPSTLPDLSRALEDPSNRHRGASLFLRRAYVDAIAKIGTDAAPSYLAKVLEDDDPAVVEAALFGLERLAGFDYRDGRSATEEIAAWKRWASSRTR